MVIFQSTRPARGATCRHATGVSLSILFQSTRPARGATFNRTSAYGDNVFQSTRPARGATIIILLPLTTSNISIHAPREGRDVATACKITKKNNFNPRAPRGARLSVALTFVLMSSYFNPRAPRGARPRDIYRDLPEPFISIHAPREGRDPSAARSSGRT